MTHWIGRFLLAGVASLPLIAYGQSLSSSKTDENAGLTLSMAVQMASERYPAIRAAEEQQEAARNRIGLAKTAYLPRADMIWQGNRSTTNKPNIAFLPQGIVPVPDTPARDTTGHSDWNSLTGVLFSWQPFDFGVRHAQVSAARFGYESAKRAADLSRLDIESAAAGAFIDLAAARQMVIVQQANVQRMEAFAKSIHVLVDNTLRPGADASQADAQLAAARTQLIQAQTQSQVRQEALANLLQVPTGQVALEDKQILATAPADNLMDQPPESNPAIQQETALVSRQTQQVHLLSRSWVPVFMLDGSVAGLGAGLTNGSTPDFRGGGAGLAPDTYNWMVALQVNFPAFQIFTIRQQKRVQEAQLGSIEATRQRMVSDVSAQVKEAQAMLDGARAVARNTPVELAAARQSEGQQRARYDSGLATVIEVSAAEAALAQAEGDDAVARLNVWRGLAGVAEAQGDLKPFLQLIEKQP